MIMNTRQNRLIIFALLLLTQTPLGAQLHSTKIELPEDSISATMEDSIPAKRSFFKSFLITSMTPIRKKRIKSLISV